MRTTVVECKFCGDNFFYKDFKTLEDSAQCSCDNLEIYCKPTDNSIYKFYITIEYSIEKPDIYEADEDNLEKRYPFW